MELRKKFPTELQAGSGLNLPKRGRDERRQSATPLERGGSSSRNIAAAAEALGEPLQSAGTLHLPGVGNRELVLPGAAAPVLRLFNGRRLIIDTHNAISAELAAEIALTWPDFSVFRPAAGDGLREVVGSLLEMSGYDVVLRSAPLTFGRGVTVRFTPDFVVLRSERDLLDGETRAISVVDHEDALPTELQELAAEFRVRIVEYTAGGVPTGTGRDPWRDPTGTVTTMEGFRLALVMGEIVSALGLPVESRAVEPAALEAVGNGADALSAIGELLKDLSVPTIGPSVEFYRPSALQSPPESSSRFVISVPGWLAEGRGRRLLITGVSIPTPVRLYLTREGIDIFEYRVR